MTANSLLCQASNDQRASRLRSLPSRTLRIRGRRPSLQVSQGGVHPSRAGEPLVQRTLPAPLTRHDATDILPSRVLVLDISSIPSQEMVEAITKSFSYPGTDPTEFVAYGCQAGEYPTVRNDCHEPVGNGNGAMPHLSRFAPTSSSMK
jgi:hypothetical protein